MSGIRVELELDDGSFTTRMIHAGETIAQFNRNVGQTYVSVGKLSESHRDLLGTLRDVSVLFGTAGQAINNIRAITTGWIGDIVKTNAEIQKTQVLLKGMSKAADPIADAAEQMKSLRALSENAPYSLQVLTKTFVQLKATGIDPMKGSIQGLIDAVSAMGGSGEVMNRAALAMSQMSGKGVIQMEELRQQLGEAVPRAAELMARSMGVSYAELVRAIATGTVEAKPALELLRQEFDRTFGGAAKANMETYDGLVARIGTSYQKLQLIAGGMSEGGIVQKGGFFDEVSNQLKDLLALMQSAQAQDFAKRLGEDLTVVIQALRAAVDTAARYKNEIVDFGKAILVAFAVSRAITAIQALGAAIAGMGTQVTLMRAQWQGSMTALAGVTGPATVSAQALATWRAQQAASLTTGTTFVQNLQAQTASLLGISPVAAQGATLMQRLAASTNIVGTATRFAAVGFATLSFAMNFMAGWLPLLVTGIMLAGEKFGWFKDRSAEAREELTKFGASGRKQVEDAFDATIAQKENELKALERAAAYNRRFTGPLMTGVNAENAREVEQKTQELNALRQQRAEQMRLAEETERKKQTDREMAELDRAQGLRQGVYDRQLTVLENYYKEERAILVKARASTQALDLAYRQQVLERQGKLYADRILADQAYVDAQLALIETGDKEAQAQATKNLTAGRTRLEEAQRAYAAFQEANSGPGGIPTLQKAIDEKKAVEKLEEKLTAVRAKSEGLRAEIAGAAGDAAQLVYQLENTSKLPKDNPAIEKLIADLKEALEIHDRLEKALKARQALERDLASAARKAAEDELELQTRGMSESDKIAVKARLGFYGDITGQVKSAKVAVEALSGAQVAMNGKLTDAKNALTGVGDQLKDAFGDATVTNIEKMTRAIGALNAPIERLRTLSDGLDVSKAFSGINTDAGATSTRGTFSIEGVGKAIAGYTARDIDLMIRTVMSEAGNQGDEGMAAVANVIKNRATISGLSLSQVVTQRNQFEPWNTSAGVNKMMSYDPEGAKYQQTAAIVKAVVTGIMGDNTGGADSFANRAIVAQRGNTKALGWIDGMEGKRQIGDHLFGRAGYGGRNKADPLDSNLPAADEAERIEIKIKEAQNAATRSKQIFDDLMGTYGSDAEEFAKDQSALGSRMKALRKRVEDKEDPLNKNGEHGGWNDPYWDDLKKAAEAADQAEKKAHESEALRRKGATARDAMGQQRQDIAELKDRADKQLQDPYSYKNSDAALARERTLRRQAEARVKGGEDESTVNAEKDALERSQIEQEIALKAAGFKRENDLLRQSLMTEGQSRQAALANQIRELDGYLSAYEQAGGKEVAVTQAIEERKRLLREQMLRASPIGKQMQEWSDFGNNLEKAATGWMSSFTDQFAEMVTTGKGDFSSLTQSIIKDIIKMGLQWSMSSLFKSFFGMGDVGGGGGGGGLLSSLFSFGAHHTGGVIGQATMSRAVSPLAFSGAPRFHTGGIIGGGLSPSMGIRRGEVPIVGLEGEGVFTKAQMKALGGLARQGDSQVISIAPSIHLTAAGGSADQNADLAARVGQQLEGSMRGLVVDELRRQLRPMGMLNR